MKILQCPKFLGVTIVCAIFLQGLTACSIPYSPFFKPTVFAANPVSGATRIQEINNQEISEEIVLSECPKWNESGRMYNPKTVETINGKVLSVDSFTSRHRMSHGIHLQVETASETIPVHLGPAWYLDNQEFEIELNDTVKVTGSRIRFDGEPAIIADRITKGNTTVKLRDKNGFPVWSGRRKQESDWNKEGFLYLCDAPSVETWQFILLS